MADAPPFHFEITLVTGRRIQGNIGADDFESLRNNNPGYQIAPDTEPRTGAARLMVSLLLYRMEKGSGFTGFRDTEGRNWLLPAGSILTFSYRDPLNTSDYLEAFEYVGD